MGVLLGLASAITYGAADYLGGSVTRRTGVFSVIVVSQAFGTSLLLIALPFFLSSEPTGRALLFGALGGVGGALGVGLFYKGLATGRMSVIAPVTALTSASLPVMFGLATGDRPAALSLVGVFVALPAVALISSASESHGEQGDGNGPAGLKLALGAGVGFAVFFIFLARAGDDAGLWPLISGRLTSLVVMVVAALTLRRGLRPNPGTAPWIAAAGLLDVLANIFYLQSTRHGLLTIVAVVTSLYPGSTVLLARLIDKERIYRLQAVGLGIALLGVTLIALG